MKRPGKKSKPRRDTVCGKIRAADNDDERMDIAIFGAVPSEHLSIIEPYMEEADTSRAAGSDPKDTCYIHGEAIGFAEYFLPPLIDGDDRFFEEIAKAIRFWKKHRSSGYAADPLRHFLLLVKERYHQQPRQHYTLRQFRELAPAFDSKADNRVREAAKDVGYKFASKELAPLDSTDRRLYELFCAISHRKH